MKNPRKLLMQKAKSYREQLDLNDELLYAGKEDELKRLRQARRDDKIIESMREKLTQARKLK